MGTNVDAKQLLSEGLLEALEQVLGEVSAEVRDLSLSQVQLLQDIGDERRTTEQLFDDEMLKTLQKIPDYQVKVVAIKQEMLNNLAKTKKLRQRVEKLEQEKSIAEEMRKKEMVTLRAKVVVSSSDQEK